MDIVLNLLEQWGFYGLAGVIVIYFGWEVAAFIHRQPALALRRDPILTVTTVGWGSLWIFGNGIGNALFLFALAKMVQDVVGFHSGAFGMPAIPGAESLVFLVGLMPSLYQFRYQSDPGYIASLALSRRALAIGMTVADGWLCALGWYWWLLPPTFQNGQFAFVWEQPLLLGALGWAILASYIAQYMVHMQLYEVLGLQPPAVPNPLAGLLALRPWREPPEPAGSPPPATRARRAGLTRRSHRTARQKRQAATTPLPTEPDDDRDAAPLMRLEELETQP